jgi:hypothetical protein
VCVCWVVGGENEGVWAVLDWCQSRPPSTPPDRRGGGLAVGFSSRTKGVVVVVVVGESCVSGVSFVVVWGCGGGWLWEVAAHTHIHTQRHTQQTHTYNTSTL